MFEDTKSGNQAIRSRKSKKDQQYNDHQKRTNGQEEFEDTKVVIRNRKWKRTYNTMTKRKRTKGQTTIYKTLHRKLKIEQHEPN